MHNISWVALLFAALIMSLSLGCASKPKPADPGKALSATDEQIFIGDSIEKNYDPNVIIKRAESFFDKEEYAEAVVEYQHFLDLHRIHQLAPYAQFRMGESHFKMIKTIDRDSSPVHKAREAFEKLLREFPGSKWDAEAQEKIRECQDFQAQNTMFIAKFYYRREAYFSAAHRFESIVAQYPDLEATQDALYYLALCYRELGLTDWAKDNLITLSQRFPNNKYQAESQKLLAKWDTELPPSSTVASSSGQSGPANALRQPQATVPPAATSSVTFTTPR